MRISSVFYSVSVKIYLCLSAYKMLCDILCGFFFFHMCVFSKSIFQNDFVFFFRQVCERAHASYFVFVLMFYAGACQMFFFLTFFSSKTKCIYTYAFQHILCFFFSFVPFGFVVSIPLSFTFLLVIYGLLRQCPKKIKTKT